MLTDLSLNDLIAKLQFIPQENSVNVYHKKYANHNNYNIEVDLDKNSIDFGNSIFFNGNRKSDSHLFFSIAVLFLLVLI